MLKNAITHEEIHGVYANICQFVHMRHNFGIRDSENAIICRKICEFWQNMRSNMRSHITGIPSYHYTTTQKFLHQHATMTSAIITGMTDAETQHTADITRSQSCTKITHVIMLISKKDTDFNKYNRNKLTVCKQKKTNQPTQE